MHTPRKRFGQNFLVDDGVIHAIVASIAPRAGDRMVEIGPGLGAMTQPLLERAGHLHVVELDRDLVARLERRYAPHQLTIHAGDALKFDFGRLGPGLRVAGNLPYNISSPLLFHLAEFAPQLVDLHFMLQKEVVDRIVAAPSTSDYGRLTVMLARRFHSEALFDVPPAAFDPPPKVMSAIVRLIPKTPAEIVPLDDVLFARVVQAAFAQRRKTLRNTLAGLATTADLEACGIDPGLRAEALPLAAFEALVRHLGG